MTHAENSPITDQRHGFTVVELLVAIAVLSLILVCFTQLIGSVSNVTGYGRERLDTNSSARLALDLIASDFANRVKRPDTDFLVVKAPGNDEFYFYSEAPALSISGTADTVALIGYRVAPGISGTSGLQRIGMGTTLPPGTAALGTPPFLPSRLTSSTVASASANAAQALCQETVRMEVEFITKTGSCVASLPSRQDSGKPNYVYVGSSGSLGQIAAANVSDWSDIEAMVVTLVCIDREKLARLTDSDVAAIASTANFCDAQSGQTSVIATGNSSWRAIAETKQLPKIGVAARVYRCVLPAHE